MVSSIDSSSSAGSPGEVAPELGEYDGFIKQAAAESGIPAEVLSGVAWAESRGNEKEPGGGLMQVTPEEFEKQKAKHPDLIKGGMDDAASNIMACAFELADLKKEYGDMDTALRVYNSGPEGLDPGNLDSTNGGEGDPDYVRNVNDFAGKIDAGQALPP